MSLIRRVIIALIGYGFILGVFGLLLILLVAPVSVYLNHVGFQSESRILTGVQKLTYPYVRNMWNAQRECVSLDPVVVYKPAIGPCDFRNIEFDTVLTFEETGRSHPGLEASGPPIAVIGDSHAMGWGVGDTETFSHLLQETTGRPVYNLGVGSYATERSIRRMLQLPDFADVDTIILQYGDNDVAENQNFPIDPARWVAVFEEKFKEGDLRERTYLQKLRFAYPLVTTELLQILFDLPLELMGLGGGEEEDDSIDHSGPLQAVLDAFADELEGRRLILFYSNGYGAQIDDLEVSPKTSVFTIEYVNLGLDSDQHFYAVDDHLNAAGHKHIADQLLERFF